MSSDEITIRDSNVTFGTLYPEIEKGFASLCDSALDVIANTNTIYATIEDVNSKLEKSLQSYRNKFNDAVSRINSQNSAMGAFTTDISLVPSLSEGIVAIPQIDKMLDTAGDLVTQLALKSVGVSSGLKYYEQAIENYNNGKGGFPSINQFIDSYLDEHGFLRDVAYVGLTCVSEALKSMSKHAGVSLVLDMAAYRLTDTGTVWGDSTRSVMSKISEVLEIDTPFWINAGVGTMVCSISTAFEYRMNDKGDWTLDDDTRVLVASAGSAIQYFTWAKVSASVGGMIGGAPGAVAGTLVAAVVVIPVGAFADYVGDIITQDNIVDRFEYNNKVYEVPRNGNGKDGTYDVLIENAENSYLESRVRIVDNNKIESDSLLYEDWKAFLFQESKPFQNEYGYSIEYEMLEQVDEIINDVCSRNYPNGKYATPDDYFEDVYRDNCGFNNTIQYKAAADLIEKYLIDDYHFDFKAYQNGNNKN